MHRDLSATGLHEPWYESFEDPVVEFGTETDVAAGLYGVKSGQAWRRHADGDYDETVGVFVRNEANDGWVALFGVPIPTVVEGDLLYGEYGGGLATLAAGADDSVLVITAGIPTWAAAAPNASLLLGATWAAPAAIGAGTPAAGAFTEVSATASIQITGTASSPGQGGFNYDADNGLTIRGKVGSSYDFMLTRAVDGVSVFLVPTGTRDLVLAGAIAVGGVASFAAGAVTAPSIARTGDLNTGLWFPAADTVAMSAGGVEVQRWEAAGVTMQKTLFSVAGMRAQGGFSTDLVSSVGFEVAGAGTIPRIRAWGVDDSTIATLSVYLASSAGSLGDTYMTLASTGLTLASLAGTGSRTVVADANGKLSAP
jgi:hypothetical protein